MNINPIPKKTVIIHNEIPKYNVNDKFRIQYKPLSPSAKVPTKSTSGSAGFNIIVLKPGQRKMIPTGISLSIPLGYYGRITTRRRNIP